MLEMVKIIHKCDHFPIYCTIPMLSSIRLVTIEGHRFLYTIDSCKYYTTNSSQKSININL